MLTYVSRGIEIIATRWVTGSSRITMIVSVR